MLRCPKWVFWPQKSGSKSSRPHISACSGPMKLKFGGQLVNMLHYFHVKFGVNRRCLSGSYLTLNVQKGSKIVFFSTLAPNSSETKGSKLVIFLLKQLYLFNNFHFKFCDDRSMLTCVFIP